MENYIKAITYQYPEKIPVSVSVLPAMWLKYGDTLMDIFKEYPDLIPELPDLSRLEENMPESYRLGVYIDEWGCEWTNVEHGMEALVTGHPVKTREDIRNLQIPSNRDGRLPHGLMYLRLLDLRGFEEAMIDFAEECEELQILIDKVLTYNCRQIEAVLPNFTGEVFYFGDDLGMQNGLAIGADKWRKYLKPCYKKMFGLVKAAGKKVFMHTDGMIYEIMPDLHECGADVINPQFRANGLDNLVRVCKGKIPIQLDLDRQLFPFATPSELDEHIQEAVQALYLPEGGLALNAEFAPDVPLENIRAVLDSLRKHREYKG